MSDSHHPCSRNRPVKQRVYARCGILEYWVLAMPEAHLEVDRDPVEGGYRTVTTLELLTRRVDVGPVDRVRLPSSPGRSGPVPHR